jgi:hypothetical protein
MQGGAYANATWVVGVAKASIEGSELIGGSCIIAPTGEVVAQTLTLGDEPRRATRVRPRAPGRQGCASSGDSAGGCSPAPPP